MSSIRKNERFVTHYQQLASVTLNPARHTAANALAHSEAVAARAVALARANACSDAERDLLEDLGRAHDIGKVTGTARPEKSLEILRTCGIDDPALLTLVKWHDTSLPWHIAYTKGQPPSDKAWRRLAAEVDLRLLALFMVADRVDAPGGWRCNAPTVWFLEQARARGLLGEQILDLADQPSEICAGGALVRDHAGTAEVLVIRVRAEGYELPKGGIDFDELPADAAVRETREEAGIASVLEAGRALGHLDYTLDAPAYRKRVHYLRLTASTPLALGELPPRTRERRWLRVAELSTIPLVNEALRPLLFAALEPEP